MPKSRAATEGSHISSTRTRTQTPPLSTSHSTAQCGTFVTIDVPTFTHRNHPKAIVYTVVHPRCCAFYGFGQKYNEMYSSLWYCAEYFHCLKNSPCCTYSYLPFPTLTDDLFTVSIILLFPKCRIGSNHANSSLFKLASFA